jgi:hypothetical protein
MPGASASRGRRTARAATALSLIALPVMLSSDPAAGSATVIHLPQPVHGVDPLANAGLGLRPDRLRTSVVPGTVRNSEHIRVSVGPSGAPAGVTDRQDLVIHGAGNYIVRELGPAREAVGLGDTVPPVLELGTVVWQGFSPGTRSLAALLTLDPGIEAARLPMRVTLEFRDRSGRSARLRPGAVAPRDGVVTVTLANNTLSARTVETGTADVRPLAGVLDTLSGAATHPRAGVPPVAGAGLPKTVPGAPAGQLSLDVVAPLRVTGTLTATGGPGAVTGPGTTPTPDGAGIAGTLSGTAAFRVRVAAGDRIGMNLDVRPWLDPRTLTPPTGSATWRAWSTAHPSAAAITGATRAMVSAAAAAARAAEYSPYLQADAPGEDLSTFTYVVASATATPRAADGVKPRPDAIAAAAVALLAVVGNAALLRRRL